MVSAINSALAGLAAASKRLEVNAANLANQFSTKSRVNGETVNQPYVPKRVDQVSIQNGGIESRVRDVNPPTVTVFEPQNPDANADGAVLYPNVDQPTELINQQIASHTYRANLQTIKVEEEMQKGLLDILS